MNKGLLPWVNITSIVYMLSTCYSLHAKSLHNLHCISCFLLGSRPMFLATELGSPCICPTDTSTCPKQWNMAHYLSFLTLQPLSGTEFLLSGNMLYLSHPQNLHQALKFGVISVSFLRNTANSQPNPIAPAFPISFQYSQFFLIHSQCHYLII